MLENPTQPRLEPVRVLFEGRYRKLVRDLPQTIFYCPECKGRGCERCEGHGKLTRDSVQELIARVAMPRFKARRNKFHGAGREDVDVRMLGAGRPFVFEMLKSKRPTVDLAELETEINRRSEGRVEVGELRFCGRKRVVEIKEARCPKEYRARIRCESPDDPDEIGRRLGELSAGGRIEIVQTTPQRVAHRRADLERQRWIEITGHEAVEGDWLVTIRSAHGTYIKEAISGDEGRTRPNLSELLGGACACVELDVTDILPAEPLDAATG
ncbi:MAG TPA: tRNA pseudouridine(54/55) synthase Pus10 [Planctomycetota bacterium]